jgi:antitoxin (DNA-binding transcriptional repressor) of toxin-antitoxin stability system
LKFDGWLRLIAPVWQSAYVLVHLWWAIGGAPRFLSGRESYFPGGWVPVALGVLALVGCFAVAATARREVDRTGHYVLAGLTAVAGAARGSYGRDEAGKEAAAVGSVLDLDELGTEAFDLLLTVLVGLAVIFQIPPVIFILSRIGIVNGPFLLRNTKYAILLSMIALRVRVQLPGPELTPRIWTSGSLAQRAVPAAEIRGEALQRFDNGLANDEVGTNRRSIRQGLRFAVMDEVHERGSEVVVTKRGKAIVRVVPAEAPSESPIGFMRGTVVDQGDIVSPDPDSWALSDEA